MSVNEKTHAEIVAEMRYKTGAICPWQVNGGTCELCPLGHSPHGRDLGKYCSFHKLAHELEAAHKSEGGNFAALREALCEILSYIESFHKYIIPGKGEKLTALFAVADTIRDKARVALAAPPRNCDIAQDWLRDLYVNFKPPASVRREMPPEWVDAVMAFCRWLVATAQEGGAK